MPISDLFTSALRLPRFHWQNLSKSTSHPGCGLRHGRCWWNFGENFRDIRLEWNLLSLFCGVSLDTSDENVTLMLALPPVAIWLSASVGWPLVSRLVPRKRLEFYPDTVVVDERSIGIRIHDGKIWIQPYSKRNEWAKADPWWVRGVTVNVNPFEWVHQKHMVRKADGVWVEFVGGWEKDKQPDGREESLFPYRYALKNGSIQERTATVFVDKRSWRPKCLQWTSLFEKSSLTIDVQFNDEVGERTGSWKGGCIGCGWEMLPDESPEQALRRMGAVRKFD